MGSTLNRKERDKSSSDGNRKRQAKRQTEAVGGGWGG